MCEYRGEVNEHSLWLASFKRSVSLFNDAVSSSDYIAYSVEWQVSLFMKNELQRVRKRSWPNLSYYYSCICLWGLRKPMEYRSKDSWSGRDFNPGPSEYDAGILTTRVFLLNVVFEGRRKLKTVSVSTS
jgi:hypothetical protein